MMSANHSPATIINSSPFKIMAIREQRAQRKPNQSQQRSRKGTGVFCRVRNGPQTVLNCFRGRQRRISCYQFAAISSHRGVAMLLPGSNGVRQASWGSRGLKHYSIAYCVTGTLFIMWAKHSRSLQS
jgi:hypothetical protein